MKIFVLIISISLGCFSSPPIDKSPLYVLFDGDNPLIDMKDNGTTYSIKYIDYIVKEKEINEAKKRGELMPPNTIRCCFEFWRNQREVEFRSSLDGISLTSIDKISKNEYYSKTWNKEVFFIHKVPNGYELKPTTSVAYE